MRVRFHGSIDGSVTGSMHELVDERLGVHILVDCGMVQGGPNDDEVNREPFPFEPSRITHVLLTHAHLDHCGRLPQLVREGFKGLVTCTPETEELARINLRTAASAGSGFTDADVDRIRFARWPGCFFGRSHPLATDVWVAPLLSSHVLGACAYQVLFKPDGADERRSITFSGDVGANIAGRAEMPTLRENQTPYVGSNPKMDTVVLESTYGSSCRTGDSSELRRATIAEEIRRVAGNLGTLIIPVFAIQRAQDVLFDLHVVLNQLDLAGDVPVFLDSPMATEVNGVFSKYYGRDEVVRRKHKPNKVRQLWRPAAEMRRLGLDPETDFEVFADMLRIALGEKPAEQAALRSHANELVRSWTSAHVRKLPPRGPRVVVAGSGMCSGGRVVSHLARELSSETTTVMLTGYASPDTPASRLLDMEDLPVSERCRLRGTIPLGESTIALSQVRARIVRVYGYSGHADQRGLVEWLFPAVDDRPSRPAAGGRVVLVHGQRHAAFELAHAICDRAVATGVEPPDVVLPTRETGWIELDSPESPDEASAVLSNAIAAARRAGSFALVAKLEGLL